MREGPSRGAYHSAEIEFVFHNLKYKDLPWRPVDEKLSDLMSTYWTNFAKTGDPNGRDLPKWPQYSQETNYQVMHLKENAKAAPATDRARYQALEKIPPQT
jgi:para-nitrobenzyl esterase